MPAAPRLPRFRGAVALNVAKALILSTTVAGAWAGLGWVLGGLRGLTLFLFAGLLVGAAVVWHGERFVLAMLGAREVPLGELPQLHSALERLAAKARVPKPRLYVIDDGHLRSFAAGTGPRRSGIALTTALIRAAQPDELEGLLAHEIAHIKRRDVVIQTLVVVVAFTLLELSRLGWKAQGALLYVLGPLAASFPNAFLSPKRELRADLLAAHLTEAPDPLVAALLRLEVAGELVVFAANPATEPLYVMNPFGDDRLARLFDTHPPIAERVQVLRAGALPADVG